MKKKKISKANTQSKSIDFLFLHKWNALLSMIVLQLFPRITGGGLLVLHFPAQADFIVLYKLVLSTFILFFFFLLFTAG